MTSRVVLATLRRTCVARVSKHSVACSRRAHRAHSSLLSMTRILTVRLAAIRALKNLGTREPQRKLMTLARTDPEAGSPPCGDVCGVAQRRR